MLNSPKAVFQLCVFSGIGFIFLGIPTIFLSPNNEVAIVTPVIFGFCMFLLGLILHNTFEIDELKKKIKNEAIK